MKNIYLLPTEKESRLIIYSTLLNELRLLDEPIYNWKHKRHIYITSDDPIKKGDWFIALDGTNDIYNANDKWLEIIEENSNPAEKIVLTTDLDLIKDGVSKIDDNFLKWFINNSDINYIDIIREKIDLSDFGHYDIHYKYHIDYPLTEDQENSLESHRDFVNKTKSEELNNIMSEFDNLEVEDKTYTFEDIINAFYNGWNYRGESEYTYPKAKKEFIENLKK